MQGGKKKHNNWKSGKTDQMDQMRGKVEKETLPHVILDP